MEEIFENLLISNVPQNNEGVPNGFQLVSLIEALNGPPNAPQMTLNVQPSSNVCATTTEVSAGESAAAVAVVDEVPNAVKAAQSLNGGGGMVVEKGNKNSPQESDKEVSEKQNVIHIANWIDMGILDFVSVPSDSDALRVVGQFEDISLAEPSLIAEQKECGRVQW